jgi:hypothetical protein
MNTKFYDYWHNHIHTINQILEKTKEFNLPLCMAFIDFEKAFDTLEKPAIIEALENQHIERQYIELIKYIYDNAKTTINLHNIKIDININRGIRQGDTMSPILFITCLEDIFRRLDWEGKGIKICGEYLNNLKFADDIVLFANNLETLQTMMEELQKESIKSGLNINIDKTKIMTNKHTEDDRKIQLNNQEIEKINNFVYLGQMIETNRNIETEINRRISQGWRQFGKLNKIFKADIPLCLKKKVFDQCILPVMTYESETWNTTQRLEKKLAINQRGMERSMLNIRKIDKIRNEHIRKQTKVIDITRTIKRNKWRWAGHVARQQDNRWTKLTTEWQIMDGKRKPGRQSTRWRDEIQSFLRNDWSTVAQNRDEWKNKGETFVQQWTANGC